MIYADTSALVPAFIREPESEAVLAWIEASGEGLLVSEWTITEFSSAAAIKVRTGELAATLAKEARMHFLEFVQAHCAVAVPQRGEFRRAAELSGNPELKLRAGDALHLAIAEAGNVRGILCLDAAMGAVAKRIGINVIPI